MAAEPCRVGRGRGVDDPVVPSAKERLDQYGLAWRSATDARWRITATRAVAGGPGAASSKVFDWIRLLRTLWGSATFVVSRGTHPPGCGYCTLLVSTTDSLQLAALRVVAVESCASSYKMPLQMLRASSGDGSPLHPNGSSSVVGKPRVLAMRVDWHVHDVNGLVRKVNEQGTSAMLPIFRSEAQFHILEAHRVRGRGEAGDEHHSDVGRQRRRRGIRV